MNVKKLSFSKKLRLLHSHEFIKIFNNSHKVITKEIIIFFNKNNLQYPRLGIIIKKKYIKHACKRNKIKRHIRENFRLHQYTLPKMDFIIRIRKNITDLNNYALKNTLKAIWLYNYDATL